VNPDPSMPMSAVVAAAAAWPPAKVAPQRRAPMPFETDLLKLRFSQVSPVSGATGQKLKGLRQGVPLFAIAMALAILASHAIAKWAPAAGKWIGR
jgi:hypothetical protein